MPRSIRNFLATHNLLAVSARYREPALNVERDLDTTLWADLSSTLTYRGMKVVNRDEMTGREEADRVYDLGGVVSGTLSFSHAQPQHFAFLLAYALGQVSTSSVGASGFRHQIRPLSGELDASRSNPSFTAAIRYGRQVMKRRFASCFIDQVRMELAKDGWAKISGVVKGTGKVTENTRVEAVTAPLHATTLTLAANGVEGLTESERLANVQAVKVLNPASQAWEEVNYTGVSGTVPGVISISPPGASGTLTTYQIFYLPLESGWTAFPARVEEPPLKVSQATVNLGGRWTGSSFEGGYTLTAELRKLVWHFHNHLTLERTPGGGEYANRALRGGREQKLTLDRDFRDFLIYQHLKAGDYLALQIKAQGPEFEAGRSYEVELVFPRVAVMAAPVKASQRRLTEEVELAVLEDEAFGSVVATVQNQVSGYAA